MVFSKDMIAGILLSSSKMNLHISVDERMQIGYNVRLRLVIRAKQDFLLALRRSLLQHEIETTYREKENTKRPKPVLYIGGIKNLYRAKNSSLNCPMQKTNGDCLENQLKSFQIKNTLLSKELRD